MVHLHIQWYRILKVDMYLQRSNYLQDNLTKDANPEIHPNEWPIAMQSKLKTKLDQMEKDGIVAKETDPTDWVNSLACSWKPNGDLQVCLDPKDLNKAIKQRYHKIPTVEEVTYELAGSKLFSKLDANQHFGM